MTHSEICQQLKIDWTKTKRGRLFLNPCGYATKEKVHYGLFKGSSDLIGFEYINNNPIFCAVEVKTKKYSTLKPHQIDWLSLVKRANGRAYVAMEKDNGYELKEFVAE